MAIKVDTVTYPAFWAGYLVNGTTDGLNESDILHIESLLEELAPARVVSTVEDSERFTNSYRLYGGEACAGVVMDYVTHEITESPIE